MNKFVNFLQDDLKEIDKSFESVKQIMVDKIYYANRGVLENHIKRIDNYISYWQENAENLEQDNIFLHVNPIGKTIYGYRGSGIEPAVAKVVGYTDTDYGDTYFAAKETETNKVHYLYSSKIIPGPVPSYGPAELGWYYEEEANE